MKKYLLLPLTAIVLICFLSKESGGVSALQENRDTVPSKVSRNAGLIKSMKHDSVQIKKRNAMRIKRKQLKPL